MELPFFPLIVHEPDVGGTDFLLSIETLIFGILLLRRSGQQELRKYAESCSCS